MPTLLLALGLFLFCSNSFASDLAAHVLAISGQVQAVTLNQATRDLKQGDAIFAQESVITHADSTVKLKFTDDSVFELGADTKIELMHYIYNRPSQTDSFVTNILKGTFRFVTGLIASSTPRSMDVNLPVATIGIRGTHVVGEASSTYAKVILLKPEKPHPTSVEVYNQFGTVTIDKLGYGTEIPDQFSPPSPIRRMQQNTIDNLTRSLQNAQRMRMPPRPRF